ncbi:conserved hypothetical protein [methanotrophic bacterial endosymbiont of Bathymodiolus sp.]|nr:conserved hypothetical protein [methanotrophic bacterial endosymbiont of Bathymodiolus sp.]
MGVFLVITPFSSMFLGLPHARGGVSASLSSESLFKMSSPRPWGCFLLPRSFLLHLAVFPTPVGVFLHSKILRHCRFGLPHARGGVSASNNTRPVVVKSSPRPWGCFSAA